MTGSDVVAHAPCGAHVVPYATLFTHNAVLHRVFATPRGRVAFTREVPGAATEHYTYGRLQRDIVDMADLLVRRKEAVARASAAASLSWLQPRRPDHVRSVFAMRNEDEAGSGGDEGTARCVASCDYLHDTGYYTTALLCGPGYAYMVALLASWAINQLATPMSVAQLYHDELTYVLEHSGCTSVLGDTALLKSKFPADYDVWRVCGDADVEVVSELLKSNARDDASNNSSNNDSNTTTTTTGDQPSPQQQHHYHHGATYKVTSMIDVQRVLHEMSERHAQQPGNDDNNTDSSSAVVDNDKDDDSDVLCFDGDDASGLNAVFRRWYTQPATRPSAHDDCLMIYTSGTTARPKGAVHTHASVSNMVRVLQQAWAWSRDDSILSVLPVHHIHGLVNVHLCALASGARCVSTNFDQAERIARRLAHGDITLFMAVPTIYTKLIAAVEGSFTADERDAFRAACVRHVRLMVSGSAALPVPTLEQFHALSGHTLLERYGMTEVGMALSQPLQPPQARLPGTVGSPLPTVHVHVYTPDSNSSSSSDKQQQQHNDDDNNNNNNDDDDDDDDEVRRTLARAEAQYTRVGALAVASDSLFDRYWHNAAATRASVFVDAHGRRYFDTGDTVGVNYYTPSLHKVNNDTNNSNKSDANNSNNDEAATAVYAILGRSSVDIIKCRGYKLSALEIEAALLSCKELYYEVAVVGVPDAVLGEAVVAVVALQPEAARVRQVVYDNADNADTHAYESAALTRELHAVALRLLAPYKCPRRYICVPEVPRNATGKVNKRALKKQLKLEPAA